MILPLLLVSVTLPVIAFTTPVPVMLPTTVRPPVMLMLPPAVVAPVMFRPLASTTVSVAEVSDTVAWIVLMLVLTATEFCAEIVSTLPPT